MRRTLITLAIFTVTLGAQAHGRHGSMNISISDDDGPIRSCSDIRVMYDGERSPLISEPVPVSGLQSLEIEGTRNGGVYISGGASTYSVTACKSSFSAANLRVSVNGNRISASGPEEGRWMVYFIVQTPRNANVRVATHNGGVSLDEVHGNFDAEATNGPITVRNSTGKIAAETKNGPITLDGGSGDVRLSVQNGPLTVKLEGSSWNGTLDGSTKNGPLSVRVPRNYGSGVLVESRGHGPVSCKAEACRAAMRAALEKELGDENDEHDWGWNDRPRRFELGHGSANVKLSTVNGPLSIKDF